MCKIKPFLVLGRVKGWIKKEMTVDGDQSWKTEQILVASLENAFELVSAQPFAVEACCPRAGSLLDRS